MPRMYVHHVLFPLCPEPKGPAYFGSDATMCFIQVYYYYYYYYNTQTHSVSFSLTYFYCV